MKSEPDEVDQITAFVAAECRTDEVEISGSISGHIRLIATELVSAKFRDAGEIIDSYLQKRSSPREFELLSTLALLILTNSNVHGAFLRYQEQKTESQKLQETKAHATLDLF